MKQFIVLFFILIATGACNLIFEEDISEENVLVLIPADGLETENQKLVFWWEYIPGALDYQLQIVCGSFSSPTMLVLDSIITEDKYEINLSPNTYQWRIRALNWYSESPFTEGSLTIVDTTSLNADTLKMIIL